MNKAKVFFIVIAFLISLSSANIVTAATAFDYTVDTSNQCTTPSKTINIQGGPGELYNLTTISVNINVCVAIAFHNGDTLDHTFTISTDSANGIALFNIYTSPGQSKTLNFQAPSKAMSIKYYCAVPGHEAAGMYGTLDVKSIITVNLSNSSPSSEPTIKTNPGFEIIVLLTSLSAFLFVKKVKKFKLKK